MDRERPWGSMEGSWYNEWNNNQYQQHPQPYSRDYQEDYHGARVPTPTEIPQNIDYYRAKDFKQIRSPEYEPDRERRRNSSRDGRKRTGSRSLERTPPRKRSPPTNRHNVNYRKNRDDRYRDKAYRDENQENRYSNYRERSKHESRRSGRYRDENERRDRQGKRRRDKSRDRRDDRERSGERSSVEDVSSDDLPMMDSNNNGKNEKKQTLDLDNCERKVEAVNEDSDEKKSQTGLKICISTLDTSDDSPEKFVRAKPVAVKKKSPLRKRNSGNREDDLKIVSSIKESYRKEKEKDITSPKETMKSLSPEMNVLSSESKSQFQTTSKYVDCTSYQNEKLLQGIEHKEKQFQTEALASRKEINFESAKRNEKKESNHRESDDLLKDNILKDEGESIVGNGKKEDLIKKDEIPANVEIPVVNTIKQVENQTNEPKENAGKEMKSNKRSDDNIKDKFIEDKHIEQDDVNVKVDTRENNTKEDSEEGLKSLFATINELQKDAKVGSFASVFGSALSSVTKRRGSAIDITDNIKGQQEKLSIDGTVNQNKETPELSSKCIVIGKVNESKLSDQRGVPNKETIKDIVTSETKGRGSAIENTVNIEDQQEKQTNDGVVSLNKETPELSTKTSVIGKVQDSKLGDQKRVLIKETRTVHSSELKKSSEKPYIITHTKNHTPLITESPLDIDSTNKCSDTSKNCSSAETIADNHHIGDESASVKNTSMKISSRDSKGQIPESCTNTVGLPQSNDRSHVSKNINKRPIKESNTSNIQNIEVMQATQKIAKEIKADAQNSSNKTTDVSKSKIAKESKALSEKIITNSNKHARKKESKKSNAKHQSQTHQKHKSQNTQCIFQDQYIKLGEKRQGESERRLKVFKEMKMKMQTEKYKNDTTKVTDTEQVDSYCADQSKSNCADDDILQDILVSEHRDIHETEKETCVLSEINSNDFTGQISNNENHANEINQHEMFNYSDKENDMSDIDPDDFQPIDFGNCLLSNENEAFESSNTKAKQTEDIIMTYIDDSVVCAVKEVNVEQKKKFSERLHEAGKNLLNKDDFSEKMNEEVATVSKQNKRKRKKEVKRITKVLDSSDDDDDVLAESPFECTPKKVKLDKCEEKVKDNHKWLGLIKQKIKTPDMYKKKEHTSNNPVEKKDKVESEILPENTKLMDIDNNVCQKGFDLLHEKILIDGRDVTTVAFLNPKNLNVKNSATNVNLVKCLTCQSCKQSFTPLEFTLHHDDNKILTLLDQKKCMMMDFTILKAYNQDGVREVFKDFQDFFHQQRDMTLQSPPVQLPYSKNDVVPADTHMEITSESRSGPGPAQSLFPVDTTHEVQGNIRSESVSEKTAKDIVKTPLSRKTPVLKESARGSKTQVSVKTPVAVSGNTEDICKTKVHEKARTYRSKSADKKAQGKEKIQPKKLPLSSKKYVKEVKETKTKATEAQNTQIGVDNLHSSALPCASTTKTIGSLQTDTVMDSVASSTATSSVITPQCNRAPVAIGLNTSINDVEMPGPSIVCTPEIAKNPQADSNSQVKTSQSPPSVFSPPMFNALTLPLMNSTAFSPPAHTTGKPLHENTGANTDISSAVQMVDNIISSAYLCPGLSPQKNATSVTIDVSMLVTLKQKLLNVSEQLQSNNTIVQSNQQSATHIYSQKEPNERKRQMWKDLCAEYEICTPNDALNKSIVCGLGHIESNEEFIGQIEPNEEGSTGGSSNKS
ncbi:uncharacterized protein LOC128209785 isoform X2 [Mya arenaria]|uniref:uncharacterized protein LOC128209785 isoform X2 n=1 Tax=Mya arenaria TaxID=6604 RepID=UPI0022E86FEF|nr:uncharacterized protein LOC128209785 isoform X2 [Mya arenaria]